MFSTVYKCNLIAVDVDQSKVTFNSGFRFMIRQNELRKSSTFGSDDEYNIMNTTRERSLNGGIHMNWYQQPSSFERLKMHRI